MLPPAPAIETAMEVDRHRRRVPETARPTCLMPHPLSVEDGVGGLHLAIEATWLAVITKTLRALWARRFDSVAQGTNTAAAAVYWSARTAATRRPRVYSSALWISGDGDARQVAQCLRLVVTAFASHRLPRPPATIRGPTRWILLFDGGSRGNPGPGGAGSVLVSVTTGTPRVEWCCATHLPASTTTNNVAEMRGLLEGLRHAWRANAHHLEVIGDSALILGWMRRRRPPKRRHLRRAYDCARHFADRIQVKTWAHHYRTANQAADYLANHAMDTGRTTTIRRCNDVNYQATSGVWSAVLERISTDLLAWEPGGNT